MAAPSRGFRGKGAIVRSQGGTLDDQYLHRPSALSVIGGVLVAVFGFSTVETILDLFQLEDIREATELFASHITAEAYLAISLATSAGATVAGVGLLAEKRWGRWAATISIISFLLFGYLVSPGIFILTLYGPLAATLIWRLHFVKENSGPPSAANKTLIAISSTTLLYAGFFVGYGVGVLVVSQFVSSSAFDPFVPGLENPVVLIGGGAFVLGCLLWSIGAGIFRFRWMYAMTGWPLIGAGTTCFYAGGSVAYFTSFPEALRSFPWRVQELIEATPVPPILATGGVLFALGLFLVNRQRQRERRINRDLAWSVEDAFS